jgi:hypothetical protein
VIRIPILVRGSPFWFGDPKLKWGVPVLILRQYGATGDDDDGDGATGNGATGYDEDNDGDWQRRE